MSESLHPVSTPTQPEAEISDLLWNELQNQARLAATQEPSIAPLLDEFVLSHPSLESALSMRLGAKLVCRSGSRNGHLQDLFLEAFANDPTIGEQVRRDLRAATERDPACDTVLIPFLWYKGFQAITCYRVAHWLWNQQRPHSARYLQSLISEVFAVDIHPAAQLGQGIFLDHATGFVVGETAVIGDDVSILHSVTLGGTGKEKGDRHPKVRRGVLIGAGAKILGNVEIGEGAKIGAGSVVLEPVAPHTTVVGVPAKEVGFADDDTPAFNMNHSIWFPTI
jgi:serine O-acetyltransferase